ncbi:hypothetical protein Acy02nite_91670 [Actinoplanes cyaneus]|uniref:Uncharacterized protein n=1 Tax=Actinoplanes cyaneus TaxID=52696 RepID=A0A919MHH5_9ACTN|nr:hypothetical protein [Actinoplanes cyaneus]MCW2144557.1 hypothetical protein [Actinoplanes cyaneus]GID71286.1 hypothetical protein Acy02nite_91670 [Actinoplanes cyaneus]
MSETNLPTPAVVGKRAAEVLTAVFNSDDFDRLRKSSLYYTDCWATFTGYPLIAKWSLKDDSEPLFWEGMRVLALKTAVFELTSGDEHAAELEISAPVDEMVHAILAQFTLVQKMTAALGIQFVHMTDQERFSYKVGGYTDQCYAAAGWGEQNRRYWIGRPEMLRRLDILGELYQSIGFQEEGRSHTHDFSERIDMPETVGATSV